MPQPVDPEEACADLRSVGLEPLEPYPGVTTRWRARCAEGHEVMALLNTIRSSRGNGGGGCRQCSIKQRSAASRIPEGDAAALMRAAGLEPLEPYPGSKKPWPSKCTAQGHAVSPTLTAIKAGKGCRSCGIQRSAEVRTGQKRQTRPRRYGAELAVADMRAAGFEPQKPYPGALAPWESICTRCGDLVTPKLSKIRSGQRGCRRCGYDKVSAALRMDPTEAAKVMSEAGLHPLEPYPGSSKPWRSRCKVCWNEVTTALAQVRGGQGCRFCGIESRRAGQTHDADQAADELRAFGYEPLVPYPGIAQPWSSQHKKCGQHVSPRLNDLKKGAGGCRWCAPWGFDYTKPAKVYVIHSPGEEAVKVGIYSTAGQKSDRLRAFARLGWVLLGTLDFPTGSEAHAFERECHDELGRRGLKPFLSPKSMGRLGGHSETYNAALLAPGEALAFVLELHGRIRSGRPDAEGPAND